MGWCGRGWHRQTGVRSCLLFGRSRDTCAKGSTRQNPLAHIRVVAGGADPAVDAAFGAKQSGTGHYSGDTFPPCGTHAAGQRDATGCEAHRQGNGAANFRGVSCPTRPIPAGLRPVAHALQFLFVGLARNGGTSERSAFVGKPHAQAVEAGVEDVLRGNDRLLPFRLFVIQRLGHVGDLAGKFFAQRLRCIAFLGRRCHRGRPEIPNVIDRDAFRRDVAVYVYFRRVHGSHFSNIPLDACEVSHSDGSLFEAVFVLVWRGDRR